MKEDNYESQNQQLRELHLLRMARKRKIPEEEAPGSEQNLQKKIHVVPAEKRQGEYKNNQIYLNSVLYDSRPAQEKINNIRLTNLLHPQVQSYPINPLSKEIQSIMISNYGFEMEVFEPIAKSGIPFFVYNRMGDQKQGKIIKEYEGFPNMTVISPPKANFGYGVFHTKLWLIKFNTFLRVVVCTSNNHLMDWAVWQNAYWYHDCPLLKEQHQKTSIPQQKKQGEDSSKLTQQRSEAKKPFDYESDFIETLKWVLGQMSPAGFDILKQMGIHSLDRYSFKDIKAILIPSISGRFKGSFMDKIGLGKVKTIMKNNCTMKNPIITVNSTSLGRLDQKFIREVYNAFSPSSGLFTLDKFKLVYPTQRYIKEKTCGEAQVLFLKPENYAKCEIKKQIYYQYSPSGFNGVEGGIPHLKTIVVQEEKSQKVVLYVGSHNLTQAAWGTFEKNSTQISCNNQELGLLFLDYSQDELLRWLPYQYPPQKYGENDKPFIQ